MTSNTKHSRAEAARKRVKPLGIHTAVGHLQKFSKWKDIPYLKDNFGRVPPFIISVGSRARVFHSANLLNFREKAIVDVEAMDKFGIPYFGRVALLIGLAESKAGTFPLMVAESQMGCPAAQINLRELLYYSNPEGYNASGNFYPSDSIYVVRAGTCGGVNSHGLSSPAMQIGDVAIATESIGSVGAIFQSSFGMLSFSGISPKPESGGASFTPDGQHLLTSPSPQLVSFLASSARESGIASCCGPNFTKDSLYAEMGEDDFATLRDRYGVISTEMEQIAIDLLARQFSDEGVPVNSGLIAAVIGAIPGKSFPETKEEHEAAAVAEENALVLAKESLGKIAAKFF